MNKIRLLLLVFFIISLTGCTPRGCSFLPKTSLEILQYGLQKSEGTAQIVGVARNNSSAKLDYADVKGKFYDEDDNLLGSAFDSTTNLPPRGIWEFTISYFAPKEAHPLLTILRCELEEDGGEAKAVGEVENNGNVRLFSAEITATFYDAEGSPLAEETITIVDLEVGEIRDYEIYSGLDYEEVDDVTVEVTSIDYPGPAEEVDHVSVEVGTLRGSTVMP